MIEMFRSIDLLHYLHCFKAAHSEIPQRRDREYSKETGVSCKRSAVRRYEGDTPGRRLSTVTSRRYGRRAISRAVAAAFKQRQA